MAREKKDEAGQNVTPKTLLEMTETPGAAPGVPPGESADLKERIDVLEQGMAKIIKVITGEGAAQPDGVEPQGGAPSQRGELIQLLQMFATKQKTEDPYMELAKESLREDLMLSKALRYGVIKRLGLKVGKDLVAEAGQGGVDVVTTQK